METVQEVLRLSISHQPLPPSVISHPLLQPSHPSAHLVLVTGTSKCKLDGDIQWTRLLACPQATSHQRASNSHQPSPPTAISHHALSNGPLAHTVAVAMAGPNGPHLLLLFPPHDITITPDTGYAGQHAGPGTSSASTANQRPRSKSRGLPFDQ